MADRASRDRPAGDVWVAVTGDVVVRDPTGHGDPRLAAMLAGADIAFGNLEVPLTEHGFSADKAATLRACPDRAHDVRRLGFDIVTLANNHMLDCGVAGLHDTQEALDAAGVSHVGAGDNVAEALQHRLRSTAHGTVGLIGLCAALPVGFAATGNRPGVAPVRVLQQVSVDPALAAEQPGMAPFVHTSCHSPDVAAAVAAVAAARAEADLVVVGIHWGIPHGFAPASYGVVAEYQQPLGRALIDAGADLVVGHHPHMVQPVERYGRGLIAYSLGNYMFHGWDQLGPTADSADGARFALQVPSAPYRTAFGDDVTQDSVVLTMPRPQAGAPRVVRFVPTTMVAGSPVVPDDERARAILSRLTEPRLDTGGGECAPSLIVHRDAHTDLIVGEVAL